jgi:putative selenate reductase
VDALCNECGNCAVFCPYNGRPYRDKFTLFRSEEDFANSENEGFLPLGEDRVKVRLDGQEKTFRMNELDALSAEAAEMIRTVFRDYAYLMQ